jgi:RNA polymerase sigma-70 factor (ECF subfamily)
MAQSVPGGFPATHWSLVLTAGQGGSPEAEAALERLCVSYHEPVRSYLLGFGIAPQETDDLVQGFFQSLLKRNSFAKVAPERGRFRSYLKAALRNFLLDQPRPLPRELRVELDALAPDERASLEPVEAAHPGDALDRAWAEQVLHLAYERLAAEQTGQEAVRWFATLRRYLADEPGAGDYAALATQFATTANNVAKRVQRLREDFDACVRVELLATVGTPAEVEHEIRALFS